MEINKDNYICNMITEYGIDAKSNAEIISELGGRFKEYRLFCDLTQKEVAEKAGVSIFTACCLDHSMN